MKLKKVFPIIAMLSIVLMAGCKKDDDTAGVRPMVISTNPINNATSIAINSKISAAFSVAMDPSTITIANFTLQQGTAMVSGSVTNTDTTATFTPAANMAPNTIYTATITAGAKDISGKTLVKDYIWSFTSGAIPDITLPTVTLTDPANSATGVALNKLIVITFSKPMDQTTITSLTFTLKQGSTPVSGAVTYNGTNNKATFTPASNSLAYNKIYTATVTTGAKDMAGNALASNNTVSFTTVNAPDLMLPMVNSIDPINNATDVASNKVVAITFSEAMDTLTINTSTFTLNQGTTTILGTVAYSGTTARFTPSTILAEGTIYTATVTTGAKDLAGNPLAANFIWSFTTATSGAGPAKVILGAAGNYVILAKTAINNNPTSAITGDLGLSPAATSYVTGFALTNATGYATSPQVTGKIYAADMAAPTGINLTTAVENMITAYNDAAGRPTPDFLELGTGNIGGKTLTPGLYKWTTTVTLPSDVTISGGANDVWIFQIAQDLTVSNAVNVTLIGNAQAKNIFWQVAGQATIGTTAHFEGVILSMTSITFQTGASFKGRALAQTAVVLDGNAVTKP
jgi:hypothetical protein